VSLAAGSKLGPHGIQLPLEAGKERRIAWVE
jgi:hypothetical protein